MKRIRITDGSTVLYADLNDTLAAADLLERIPCEFEATDSGTDFSCPAPRGVYDPTELQTGWRNGDISLGDGWFAILYAGQEDSEAYGHMMIVGHLDEDSLKKVRKLPAHVTLRLDLAQNTGGNTDEISEQRRI